MTNTRAFRIWSAMRQRCLNPQATGFANWGGRGIKVCERWSSFENFFADMGAPPIGTTLDRKDNNGDYTPDNCMWATRSQQARNRRGNRMLTLEGETLCSEDWARRVGISRAGLMRRIDILKWPLEKALTTGRTR
jgi:hypothetical protein